MLFLFFISCFFDILSRDTRMKNELFDLDGLLRIFVVTKDAGQ
jgi:hypothetical protein